MVLNSIMRCEIYTLGLRHRLAYIFVDDGDNCTPELYTLLQLACSVLLGTMRCVRRTLCSD